MKKAECYVEEKKRGECEGGGGDSCLLSQLLGRLRQENCLNPGDGVCIEPRSHYCNPAWTTGQDSISKTKTHQ